jgi:hypothetical protein
MPNSTPLRRILSHLRSKSTSTSFGMNASNKRLSPTSLPPRSRRSNKDAAEPVLSAIASHQSGPALRDLTDDGSGGRPPTGSGVGWRRLVVGQSGGGLGRTSAERSPQPLSKTSPDHPNDRRDALIGPTTPKSIDRFASDNPTDARNDRGGRSGLVAAIRHSVGCDRSLTGRISSR